jgi:hypothetical protein
VCINNDLTKIINGLVWCLFFILPNLNTTIFRELGIVVIVLFFFIVFHYNPSFSVFGLIVIVGHETRPNQVVKGT